MLLQENEDGNSAHQSAQVVCLMSDVLFCFLFILNKKRPNQGGLTDKEITNLFNGEQAVSASSYKLV